MPGPAPRSPPSRGRQRRSSCFSRAGGLPPTSRWAARRPRWGRYGAPGSGSDPGGPLPDAEAGGRADLGFDAEVDRTEASIAPARGGDRTPDTRAPDSRRREPGPVPATGVQKATKALFLGAVLLGILPAILSPPASAPSGRHVDHLTLVRQSPWVGPNPPSQDLTMGLRIRSGAPTSALRLSFPVFRPVPTRSGF